MSSSPTGAPVLFEERFTDNGMRVGIATLNAPQALNSLSLEMVDLLYCPAARVGRRTRSWRWWWCRARATRAFCAGGDLQGLYRGMREHAGRAPGPTRTRAIFSSASTGSITISIPIPSRLCAGAAASSWAAAWG